MVGVIPAEARFLSTLGTVKKPSSPQNPRIVVQKKPVN
jgi:hypothetical protein